MSGTLEDDILRQEFGGKETNIMDAEVIYQRPKPKRPILPVILVGVLVLTLMLGGLFFNEIKSMFVKQPAVIVKIDTPVIQSATIPEEINEAGAKQEIPAAGEVMPSPVLSGDTKVIQNTAADTKDNKVPGTSEPTTAPQAPDLSNTVVTPDFTGAVKNRGTDTKPITPAAAALPAKIPQPLNNDRLDALDTKIRDLTLLIAELTKRVDAVALEKKENPPKQLVVSKSENPDKKRTFNLPEVTRSMKELHILALLSDGVMFEGDIAVSVGQYAKHLKGKIVSINTDQNIITTDSKIFKVL